LFGLLQGRRAFGDLADLRSATHSNVFENAAKSVQPGAPVATALTNALRDAQAAVQSFDGLQAAREVVVESRMEALQAKDAEIAASRESMKAEMASKKASLDSEFMAVVKPLASVYSS
jgi:hypothetical protein